MAALLTATAIVPSAPNLTAYTNAATTSESTAINTGNNDLRAEVEAMIESLAGATDSVAQAQFRRLIDSVSANRADLDAVDELIEEYLSYPDSPYYDDTLFCVYLQQKIASDAFDKDSKERATLLLQYASLNLPGTAAADFKMLTPGGKPFTLADFCREAGRPVLLMFYDPECEDCHAVLYELETQPQFASLPVLAVYDGDDEATWLADAARLSDYRARFARTISSVEASDLYTIPSTPTLLLIAPDLTVVLKNTTLQKLTESGLRL